VASITINVNVCGCTDPAATNYNPNANVNDGSCVYPTGCTDSLALNFDPNALIEDGSCEYARPEAPNVITPGGVNPYFFILQTESLSYIELTILNRWGNVIYEASSANYQDIQMNNNPKWDGTINGTLAEEGIYFYKYSALLGQSNQEVTGHGFFHLVHKK